MKYLNKKIILMTPFILSMLCFVSYAAIGSYVAEDGALVEPFAFIPMGYLFFALGIVLIILRLVMNRIQS